MKALTAIATLALAGCATGGLSNQAQPRALVTAPAAPSCFILCFVEVVTNTTDEDIKSQGGGAITNTTSESEVISGPSMGVGSGTSAAKPSDDSNTRNIRPVIVPVLPQPVPERRN